VRSRSRNLGILALVAVLLVAAGGLIATKKTRLGLDLKGGTELVYQGRPTPKVPKVTPQAMDDALNTIRKRTDALGVSEPEIQRSGSDQLSIGLPDISNPKRAIEQVGSTAQLQFYDFEPNLFVRQNDKVTTLAQAANGQPALDQSLSQPLPGLWDAVQLAKLTKPRAEASDIPPGGPNTEELQKAGISPSDKRAVEAFYDRQNDTRNGPAYYLFGPDRRPLGADGKPIAAASNESITPSTSCKEALSQYEAPAGGPTGKRTVPKDSACREQLAALGTSGPPAGSRIVEVPRGIVVIKADRPSTVKSSAPYNRYYVFEDDSELSGTDVTDPKQEFNPDNQSEAVVTMKFTDRGRPAFERLTKRVAHRGSEQSAFLPPGANKDIANQRFAITLDNEVISNATIDYRRLPDGIDGRTGAEIEGLADIQEAQDLANNMRIGALPITLKLISQTQVSATLGKQALHQGLIAGAVGLALTILFLLFFYRVLGVVATVALLIYAVLLFALVKLIPITLTLPGIAGLVLTLAVAADANIVMYERIKEEVRAGRSIPAAISGGYAKALKTIIDANVVTIGVAFLLFMLATAGVKGFAFTLGIGTLVSLFTAVLGTSAILGTMARSRLLRSRHALGAGVERLRWHFDFMGNSRWFFSMSGVIIAAGAIAIASLGINFGIDFESGTRITTPLERSASTEQVRSTLSPLGYSDAKIQQVNDPDLGRNVVQIAVPKLEPSQVQRVQGALDKKFGVQASDFSSSSIGPTFGAQIARTAVIAIIASLLLISIYIGFRFEFKFAVPVLIALAHDLLITAGVYALTEREVSTSTVAALLTILGYSLYDTVIVFDRIRENVPRMPRATFSQIANRSMSEVLTRSLATSFSALFPVGALMLFGGETLKDFAFALLVGVASGAYSSIFIATPVLTEWKEREPVYMRRRRLQLEQHGGVVPAFATDVVADGEPAAAPAAATAGTPRDRRAARAARAARTGRPKAPRQAPTAAPPPPAIPQDGEPAGDGAPTDGDGARETDGVSPPPPRQSAVTSTSGGGAPKPRPKQKRRNRARKKHGRR
jgi:SecD/SecF fusion protein